MGAFGDESGIFWTEVPRERGKQSSVPRMLPPIPESDWRLPDVFPDLSSARRIAIDVETHDPDLSAKGPGVRRDGYICGVAVGTDDGFRKYYPIRHENGPNLEPEIVYGWLRKELIRPRQEKVGANLLYDLDYLEAAGVKVDGPCLDVQIAEPLLDENAKRYALEALGQKYLQEGKVEDDMAKWLTKAFGAKNIKSNIWRAPPSVVAPYAEGDVDLPLRVLDKQLPLLEEQGLLDLFHMECKLIPMLLAMRQRGVRVDLDAAEQLRDRLKGQQKEYEDELRSLAGFRVGINENASIAKMFDAQGIQYPRTAKGAPSFVKEWLQKHPSREAQLISLARGMEKFNNTFVEGYVLDGQINGRIHCEFHQLKGDDGGTVSGRFSSSNPNLQNIPSRDPVFGPLIRGLFIPEEGQQWWKYDWSQIEYRIIVHYAFGQGYPGAADAVNAYNSSADTDFHQVIADMTGLDRKPAKNLNFGLAYGQGIDLLCFNLGVSREEGKNIIDTYHQKAPFIRKMMDATSNAVRRRGYLSTLMKRRRRFDVWENPRTGELFHEPGPGLRRAFLHKALNALIQGSAADVMKKAMVEIWESGVCDPSVLGAPHLTVHDELDGSKPEGKIYDEALAEVKHIMETTVDLSVPLIADGGLGPNWASIE